MGQYGYNRVRIVSNMVKSDYVFESGDPIDVGTHGEHDYVYHSGEAVNDSGQSEYVFESGTGLGGGGAKVLVYVYGNASMSEFATQIANTTGRDVDRSREGTDLSSLLNGEYTTLYVVISKYAGQPSSSDITAISDFWDSSVTTLSVLAEDNSDVPRGTYAQSILSGIDTSVSFDADSYIVGANRVDICTSKIPPSGNHPAFSGVSQLSRRNNELGVSAGGVWSDPTNVWAAEDQSKGRIWLDGSHLRLVNGTISSCDNTIYTQNLAEWLDP